MKRKTLFLFLFGCAAYPSVETAWRGFTHYSMCLAGGLCVCLTVFCCSRLPKNLLLQCFAGGFVITGIEFIFGVIFNLWLGMQVWDYSHVPFNILGQVCPRLSCAWACLTPCILGVSALLDQSPALAGTFSFKSTRLYQRVTSFSHSFFL